MVDDPPNPVFCAVDTAELGRATTLTSQLRGVIGGLKLGLEFFAAQGPVGHGAEGAVGVGEENGRRRHHPLPVCVTMGSMTRNTVRRGWLVNSMTPP